MNPHGNIGLFPGKFLVVIFSFGMETDAHFFVANYVEVVEAQE